MKKKIIIGVVVAIVLLIIAMPYIKDYKAYSRVKSENTISSCDWYVEEFPDGRYLDEVLYLKVNLSDNDMPVLVEYLNKCPQGEHANEINSLCDQLWDNEIIKYTQRDKNRESAEAVAYMTEMLQYMKSHRINTIAIDINPTLKLKDYDEYDKEVRDFFELINDNSLSIEKGMISLKSNFTSSDNHSLMEILTDGVQRSMNKMFSPDFITVIPQDISNGDMPQLHFDYTISSQEEKDGDTVFPHLWTYSDHNGRVLNYLVGISITFNAHFSIPGSSTTFDYSEKGEPASNINNVEDIRDGYRQMTAICFAQFSNKMSTNLGLKETYFQGEEE